MKLASVIVCLLLTAWCAYASDWPQWRGPTRDGVGPAGPKLLDAWPTNGPAELWRSTRIPSGKDGGCGSVTVAGGKAYLFVNERRQKCKPSLTTQDLKDLGWRDDLSDELAKKIEDARMAERVNYINSRKQSKVRFMNGAELESHITNFVASLDAAIVAKYGAYITNRLHQGPMEGVDWKALGRLATVQNKEFDTIQALGDAAGENLYNWHGGTLGIVRNLLTARIYDYFDIVVCLDAATGKEAWRRELPGVVSYQAVEITASCTPSIADGKCYAAGSAGFYCLDAKDGAVVWQTKSKLSNSSPLVQNGVVYQLAPELTAFDAVSGKVVWTQPGVKSDCSSVAPWSAAKSNFLLVATEKAFCIDAATGAVVWQADLGGGTYATPVVVEDVLVLHGSFGLSAFKIAPQKAELLWNKRLDGDPRGETPVVWKDAVYTTAACYCGTPLRCVDLKTGELKWEPKGGNFGQTQSSSAVLADGKLFHNANDALVVMFRATPDKYEELGRFNPGTATCTSPTVVDGKMYLRLKDCIACYDLTAPPR